MTLFDHIRRTNDYPSLNSEGTFPFLNRSSAPYWEQVRNLLEDWFSQYPVSEGNDLRSRLRSPDNHQFYSAFWELYLHETLHRTGNQVITHPEIKNRSTRPDFAVTDNNRLAHIEALCVFDPVEEQKQQGILTGMFDYLNVNVKAPYYLVFEVDQYGTSTPRANTLSTKLKEWLTSLSAQSTPPDAALFEQTFELGDWIFRITATPKAPGRDTPLIAAYPMVVRWVDDHVVIRDRLSGKARKYGDLVSPYTIGVWTSRITTDLETVMRALFGADLENPEHLRTGTLPTRYPKHAAGLWVTPEGPKRREVSAIIYGHGLFPWSITNHSLVVIHNPWASHQFLLKIPFAQEVSVTPEGNLAVKSPAGNVHDFFDLPLDWPGGEPFPDS